MDTRANTRGGDGIEIALLKILCPLRPNKYMMSQKTTLEDIIKKSAMDEMQKSAFAVIVKSICQPPAAFCADLLYDAMKGPETNHDTLIRIIVGRSELNLADIKSVFQERRTIKLAEMVKQTTSGDYRNILLDIINAPKATQSTTT